MKRTIWLAAAAAAASFLLSAQINLGTISGGDRPAIAIPDLRGAGDAQKFMGAFNSALQGDISGSGFFKIAPRTNFPPYIPQQPSDFIQPPPIPRRSRVPEIATSWSARPPAEAAGSPIGPRLR